MLLFHFLYVYPEIKENKLYYLVGQQMVIMVYLKKAMCIMVQVNQKKKFDEFRDNYFDINNQAGYLWHELIAETIRNN